MIMTKALVHIDSGAATMEGMLELPTTASGVVLFAHGSGSSRLSPRNNHVAHMLRDAGIGTLLLDLLTPNEDRQYHNRFDITLLRNVLIYFDDDGQRIVLDHVRRAMAPEGVLIIGESESLTRLNVGFEFEQPLIYRRQENAHA